MAKTQTLAFPLRVPDAQQPEALRLLDASRTAVNDLLTQLWPHLDSFAVAPGGGGRTGSAWKQLEGFLPQRSGHGDRQERCEMEQAGRILRAHATRKQVFLTSLPLLSDGLIHPAEEYSQESGKATGNLAGKRPRPARKDHHAIADQVRKLRDAQRNNQRQQQSKQDGAHTTGDDLDSFMALTNVIEQACNYYLRTGRFPDTYEQMQPLPVLAIGQLTFAGDDGMQAGQTYRSKLVGVDGPLGPAPTDSPEPPLTQMVSLWSSDTSDEVAAVPSVPSLVLKLRSPNVQGHWSWGEWGTAMLLPEAVVGHLRAGATLQAPTLRELKDAGGHAIAVLDLFVEVPARYVTPLEQERRVLGFDWGVRSLITVSVLEQAENLAPPVQACDNEGTRLYQQINRPLFLDTGGIDGRQARLRREIDRLKACKATYEALLQHATTAQQEHQTPLPGHFPCWQGKVDAYNARITQCWKTYSRRNRELAHLAANLLILFAVLHDCQLIVGENLTTLKTVGRGKGVRGRFRNWRNNTTVRGELWRVLNYKCYLLGLRARQVEPGGTSHTCPRCHQPADTYRSPAPQDRSNAVEWGAWLCCSSPSCGWNGSRDYAASLNIAALGMAFLTTYQQTKRYASYRLTSKEVNSCSYSRQEATLLLPSQGITPRPKEGKHVSYAGWSFSVSLRTAHPHHTLALLSTAQLRQRVVHTFRAA